MSVGMGHAGLGLMKSMGVQVPPAPCTFRVIRRHDEGGISGTGCTMEGVVFSTGKCNVQWLSEKACIQHWDSFEDFLGVHINSHPANRSLILWSNGDKWEHADL